MRSLSKPAMPTNKTKHFPDSLINTIDRVVSSGSLRAFNETQTTVFLRTVDEKDAEALRDELIKASWFFSAEDSVQPRENDQSFEGDFGPFSFQITKPTVYEDSVILVHRTSLVGVLESGAPSIIRVGRGTPRFDLHSSAICGWEEPVEFSPDDFDAEANRMVRDLSGENAVPTDLSIWLLRNPSSAPAVDPVFNEWKIRSAAVHLRVLCSEIEPGGTLVFRGQPVLRIANPGQSIDISHEHFQDLHALVSWVYETKREAETRHGLAVAEIVRGNLSATTADELIANGFKGVLESARHAYQLGLHKLSKDSLQALADLRKSVGDETSKAADLTRHMATSVAGALFAAIGVLAARLTLAKDSEAFSLIAVIVASVLLLYVAATARTGWHFIGIQRSLRSKWKERTRKYLSNDEYAELVEGPTRQAESAYNWTAWLSILIAFVTAIIVAWFSYPEQATALWEWMDDILLRSSSTSD